MSGLAELAGIIDGLYLKKKQRKYLKQKIVVLVGNGIFPVGNILNDDDLEKKAEQLGIKLNTSKYLNFKWQHFEYARYFTQNYLPSFAHCCIWKLVSDGLSQDIITTNYDLFFDSIWSKYPNIRISQNPVLSDDEYEWEGYFSNNVIKKHVRYWKIHGSLSHIVFKYKKETPYIFRLPRFVISSNEPGIKKAYNLKHYPPFLGYESIIFSKTDFSKRKHLDARFTPYIDWSFGNKRSLFQREISGARSVLSNPQSLAAVLLIGFRGFYANKGHPWNEELVEDLNDLLDSGYKKIYMAVHKKQYALINKPTSKFMQRLDSLKHCWEYEDSTDFCKALFKHSQEFPYNLVEDEYLHWKLYWFLTDEEGTYRGGK